MARLKPEWSCFTSNYKLKHVGRNQIVTWPNLKFALFSKSPKRPFLHWMAQCLHYLSCIERCFCEVCLADGPPEMRRFWVAFGCPATAPAVIDLHKCTMYVVRRCWDQWPISNTLFFQLTKYFFNAKNDIQTRLGIKMINEPILLSVLNIRFGGHAEIFFSSFEILYFFKLLVRSICICSNTNAEIQFYKLNLLNSQIETSLWIKGADKQTKPSYCIAIL